MILDRDGVINEDSEDFIKSPEELVPIRGSLEAIARLAQAGHTLVVASNQSGLARGLFDEDDLEAIHSKLDVLLAEAGGYLDGVFLCPHGPDDGCACRKPEPGLLREIAEVYHEDLSGVPFVGDSARDLEAARAAGATPVLVRTGNGADTEASGAAGDAAVYDDLAAFAEAFLEESRT